MNKTIFVYANYKCINLAYKFICLYYFLQKVDAAFLTSNQNKSFNIGCINVSASVQKPDITMQISGSSESIIDLGDFTYGFKKNIPVK